MSQLQVTGEAKIRDIQGPVVANSGVITALDGAASQYVRGDGTLADFPTSTGGGSSVSYYLNSSVSQGTIGGVAYRELSKEPIIGAGTDITISANGYVASYITDANDPDVLSVPGGNFNCEFYFSVNNNTGNPTTYAELYKYDGTTFTLLGSSQAVPESINQGTTIAPYYFAIPVATAALALTDRLAIRIYVSVDGRVVTLHTENSHLCQVVTTFSKGMVSLNNLTDQSQFITTGTSGTNFNIVSTGDTHTFNLPVASATNTGKLSNTDWSTFNNKVPYTGATSNVDLGTYAILANAFAAQGNGISGGVISLKQNGQVFAATGSAYIGSESAGKLNIYFGDSGLQAAILDNSLLTVDRTYNLPDASGTLALTSNLSSYVPYTGATGNVDLGLFGLTSNAVKAIGDNSTYGGVISIKQNNVIGGLIGTGYTELFGKTNRLGISFGAGSIAYLSNSVLTAERTYTLPDITGTLALLEGSQTFSGLKTFDAAISANYGIALLNGAIPALTSIYYAALSGNSTGISITYRTGGGINYTNNLNFPDLNNSYLFPSASGTLALTSDLGAYLPLTGGTLTGNLTINPSTIDYTLTVSTPSTNNTIKLLGSTASNTSTIGYWSSDGGTGYGALNFTPTNTRFEIVNGGSFSIYTSGNERLTVSSGGTTTLTGSLNGTSITLTNDIYLENNKFLYAKKFSGATAYSLIGITPSDKVLIDGSGMGVNFGGALSGTSATFSGNVAVGTTIVSGTGNLQVGGTANSSLFAQQGTDTVRIGVRATGRTGIAIDSSNATYTNRMWYIDNNGANGSLYIGRSGLDVLTLANTGAATFSSSVEVGQSATIRGFTGTTGAGMFLAYGSAGAGIGSIYSYNYGTSTYGGTVIDGSYVAFYNSGSEKMRITGGNVGIGTTAPSARLAVHKSESGASAGAVLRLENTGANYTSTMILTDGTTNDGRISYLGATQSLGFGVGSTANQMIITSSGNVGVGTTAPTVKLHSYSTTSMSQLTVDGAGAIKTGVNFASGGTTYGQIYFDNNAPYDMSVLQQYSTGSLIFGTNNTERLRIANNGLLYSLPTYANASGSGANVGVFSNGEFYRSTSSLKYKKNVENYTKGLAEVMQMRPVTYNSINEREDGILYAGLIAEEVHDLGLTEFVQYAEDGSPDALAYQNMVSLLVKAIQEQQAQIEELKSLINK